MFREIYFFSALYAPRSRRRSRSQEPVPESEPEPLKLRSPEPPKTGGSATLHISIIGSHHDPIPHGDAHPDSGCVFEPIKQPSSGVQSLFWQKRVLASGGMLSGFGSASWIRIWKATIRPECLYNLNQGYAETEFKTVPNAHKRITLLLTC